MADPDPHFDSEVKLQSVWSFDCSSYAYLWALRFPPTSHAELPLGVDECVKVCVQGVLQSRVYPSGIRMGSGSTMTRLK